MGALDAPKSQEAAGVAAEAQPAKAETVDLAVNHAKQAGEQAVGKEVMANDPHAKALTEAGFDGIQLKKAEKKEGVDKSTYDATLDGKGTQISIQLSDVGAKVELTTFDPVSVVTSKANGDRELAAEVVPDLVKNVVKNYRKSRS